MGYDKALDERVAAIAVPSGAVRKPMFGGTGYLLNGNMMAGVHGEFLVLRLSGPAGEAALTDPSVHPFDMTRRPMAGWVMVEPAKLGDQGLRSWLDKAHDHAESLPPK